MIIPTEAWFREVGFCVRFDFSGRRQYPEGGWEGGAPRGASGHQSSLASESGVQGCGGTCSAHSPSSLSAKDPGGWGTHKATRMHATNFQSNSTAKCCAHFGQASPTLRRPTRRAPQHNGAHSARAPPARASCEPTTDPNTSCVYGALYAVLY